MSILHSSARPSGASRRSSEVWLREALLAARRGPVVHRATKHNVVYILHDVSAEEIRLLLKSILLLVQLVLSKFIIGSLNDSLTIFVAE